ncbi:phage tail assembly protein [Dickeya dianthicola]|uniref:Phage tail assembly protein n=1 Tax=Dickeya dianthicola TaxID=204039 RepID=A0AAX1C5F7_9GAMM|nr:phage tail assembly protein [Dickeya dianthicola]ATO31592.1 Tail protein [Dickeya dianthicola RNS04.9]MBT1430971.1 phage tail assembly protein [Dickeya dianthicola]MCA7005063.1 phage tail assembly protein [Dickeya dianthicola]MCI4001380.1 phage tail assembly protein [Dickeya dianthicola]MCI4031787.1 phage tail assembly protein [Dickeya dianthicola]
MQELNTEKTVTLDSPLKRGDTVIDSITIRKPTSGALRGVRLQALMEMDVNAVMVVLPRVTAPALTATEVLELDPADLVALAVEVVTFLLPKSARQDSPAS